MVVVVSAVASAGLLLAAAAAAEAFSVVPGSGGVFFFSGTPPPPPRRTATKRAAAVEADEALSTNDALLSLASRLLGDARQRDALLAMYAWCRRADDVADDGAAPLGDRLARLGAIEADLEAAVVRREAPRNAVDERLVRDAFDAFDGVAVGPFQCMLRGMRTDLSSEALRFESWDRDLRPYCSDVAGTVGLMLLPVLLSRGPPDPETIAAAVDLGVAIQLTNILRDVGFDARELNRVYLPQEDLRAAGADEATIFRGEQTPAYQACVRFQVRRARELYASAAAGTRRLPPTSRFVVFAVIRLLSAIVDELEARNYDSLTAKVRISTSAKVKVRNVQMTRRRPSSVSSSSSSSLSKGWGK